MRDELGNNRRGGAATIELHIEELVLEGFKTADRERIGDAVERELGRLLTERGLSLGGPVSTGRVNAGAFQVKPDATAAAVGRNVAARVYKSVSQPRPVRRGT